MIALLRTQPNAPSVGSVFLFQAEDGIRDWSVTGVQTCALPIYGTPEKWYGGRVFRAGDKVTQLRNNYDKGKAGVFNGTVGVVTGLSVPEQALTVLTDEDEQVAYDFAELDELAHAYAVTIHRSQGSEYPAVVIPLTTASWVMLQRNLLYTGITRAKKLLILAGSRRALAQAVRTRGAGRRHTALTHRLHPGGQASEPKRPAAGKEHFQVSTNGRRHREQDQPHWPRLAGPHPVKWRIAACACGQPARSPKPRRVSRFCVSLSVRSPVSACCSSDERGDYVGSVPVQGPPGAVVADRGPRVGMGGGFLYVPQRNPGIERRGDERVPQRMRPDRFGDPGAAGGPADDPGRAVPVQPAAIKSQEDRPVGALADGQAD